MGLLDHETGKLHLRNASYFSMESSIKRLHQNENESKTDPSNYKAARNLLGETFGTKKKKKEIKSEEKNKVDVQDLASSALVLDTTIEKKLAQLPGKEQVQEEMEMARPVPAFDKSTTKVDEIYKIESIISLPEFEIIPTQMFSQLSAEKIEALESSGTVTPFVSKCLKKLMSKGEKVDLLELSKIVYLQLLIHFKGVRDSSFPSLTKNQKLNGIFTPKLIISKFLETFSTFDTIEGAKKYKMSSWHKEKLMAHISVLALIIDGFSCPVELLAKDLKITSIKMTERFKAVGCSVETIRAEGVSSKIATLKAPLQFPKPRIIPKTNK